MEDLDNGFESTFAKDENDLNYNEETKGLSPKIVFK